MTSAATSLIRPGFDDARAKAFAGRMMGALNDASLVLMSAIGHRTGLFDSLARVSPCTADELAAAAGLAERYVREWLAVMVTARIVDFDATLRTYHLAPEHAALLTRGAATNMAVLTQFVSVAASVEEELIARFRDGKGMHYHDYGRFHEVMAEQSGQNTVANLIERILPLDPALIPRLQQGIDVIDVGCGAGRALLRLAEAYPASRFVGLDLCADAFAPAIETARRKGLTNLRFQELDVADARSFGDCDLALAFDAIHDQRDPVAVLRAIRRSLRTDGTFIMVEIGGSGHLERDVQHPLGPFLYMISCMHCTAVSLGQGGKAWGAMWGVERATEVLTEAGFASVEMTRLPHDLVNAYFVARP